MADQLLARLEALVVRLEKANGIASPAPSAAPATASAASATGAVAAYKAYLSNQFAAFISAAKVFPDLGELVPVLENAFKNFGDVVEATTACQAPSSSELLAYMSPVAKAIEASNKAVGKFYKSQQNAHMRAIEGAVVMLSFPFSEDAVVHVEGSRDSGNMYNNRILVAAKNHTDATVQENDRNFVAALQAAAQGFVDFVKVNFKKGLTWNTKGGALTSFVAGASAAPGGPEEVKSVSAPAPVSSMLPPPPGPAPKPMTLADLDAKNSPAAPASAAPATGMTAVFASINQGLNVTAGLRKVTADMKSKNRKDEPPVAPSSSAPRATAPAAAAQESKQPAAKVVKPPSITRRMGNYNVENFVNDSNVFISDVNIKEGIYIGRCTNSIINIVGKPKSIALDKCLRVTINVADVLSTIELVDCDRCTLYLNGKVPTVAMDKSKGIIVSLTDKGFVEPPQIYTSNISECNVQVPGATPDDDIIEIPIPEQFIVNVSAAKKLSISPVSH